MSADAQSGSRALSQASETAQAPAASPRAKCREMTAKYPIEVGRGGIFNSIVPRDEYYSERLPLPPAEGEPRCPRSWSSDIGGEPHFWVGRDDWADALGARVAYGSEDELDFPDVANPVKAMDSGAAQCLACYDIRAETGEIVAWEDIAPAGLRDDLRAPDGIFNSPPEIYDCLLPAWRGAIIRMWESALEQGAGDETMQAIEVEGARLWLLKSRGKLVEFSYLYDPSVFTEWEPGDLAERGF